MRKRMRPNCCWDWMRTALSKAFQTWSATAMDFIWFLAESAATPPVLPHG